MEELLRKIGRELEQQTGRLKTIQAYLGFLVFVTGLGLIGGLLTVVVGT